METCFFSPAHGSVLLVSPPSGVQEEADRGAAAGRAAAEAAAAGACLPGVSAATAARKEAPALPL